MSGYVLSDSYVSTTQSKVFDTYKVSTPSIFLSPWWFCVMTHRYAVD